MRVPSALLVVTLAATALAGCLGGDEDVGSAIPRAVVKVTEVPGKVDTFLFDGSGSTGRGLGFQWEFGDGAVSTEEKVEHTYQYGAALYDAKLTITDVNGIRDMWEQAIKVGDGINLPPKALFKPSTRYLAVNEPLTVDARITTDPEGDPIRYEWDFNHIMTESEYIDFREAKQNADYDDSATVTVEEEDDTPTIDGVLDAPNVPDVADVLGEKDGGHDHGGSQKPVSLFNGFRTTEEPVFTLAEGFPDATTFYVRLVALDIKGASKETLSEEIWPVEVVQVKKKEIHTASITDTFQLGSPATVQEATPNDEGLGTTEYFDDDRKWPFEIPDKIDLMYVNVTWSQNPAESQLANDIDLTLTSPNGKERVVAVQDKAIKLELTRFDELDTETTSHFWTIDLVARAGFDINYTVSYWAKVDLNPFREIEAPYVEDDAPRDEGDPGN